MIRSIAALIMIMPLSGCFVVQHEYTGPKILTSDATVEGRTVRKVRHFEVHDRQFFWLHGGYPVGEDLNGAALAAREAGTHGAVVNLKITDGQNLTDMAVTHIPCVLSLLCGTWSVWAEGDVADVEVNR